jgi:ABC-type branched-subunit amino acid transport system ATPase component
MTPSSTVEEGRSPASAPSGPFALEVRDIEMRFGGVIAVNGVSLAVPSHAIVGLIGPNGAGKSTLFDVCSGLRRPNSGSVLMDGVDVTNEPPRLRAHRGLGRTFQRTEIFYTMTVRDHLALAYRCRSSRGRVVTDMLLAPSRWRTHSDEDRRVDELLASLGLEEVQHRAAISLPLGLRRSLEVGRALACEPTILLLDEPSSGLNIGETQHLGAALRAAAASEGVALLLVEHDLDLVLGLAQEVYVLDFGTLIFHGTPAEVRKAPSVQSAYLGIDVESNGDDPGA